MFTYFIVIANIYFFQIDRLEPSFTDSVFRFRFRDSVSGFRILVLPGINCLGFNVRTAVVYHRSVMYARIFRVEFA